MAAAIAAADAEEPLELVVSAVDSVMT
jgi:hypothetical protein